jgi:hypothetical protein
MRRLLPLAAALAALLCAAAAAQATLVPQKGLMGVRLGQSQHHVRAVLGAPDGTRVRHDEILGRARTDRYGRTTIGYDGTRAASHVITLSTTSRHERLAGGVGVGSRRSKLRAALPALRCQAGHCTMGRVRAGRVVTDFTLRHGRVARITIGRVID